MKEFALRVFLVVALLLLASVGTAAAECAWVLWIGDRGDGWRVADAYESKPLCHAGPSLLQAINSRLRSVYQTR
jgi:hypothetical protein